MRLPVCVSNRLVRDRNTAGVSVLDDGDANTVMVVGGTPGGIGIHVVVVAHGFTVQLLRLGDTRVGIIQVQRC